MLKTILTLCWLLAPGPPQKPGSDSTHLDQDLLQGTPDEQRKAVEFVLAHSSTTPSAQLLMAALAGFRLGRLEDAGFLFFAGKLRSRIDVQCFPPVGQGGDSPGVALGALSYQIGAVVNPAIMREPKSYKAVIERLRAWDVQTPRGYDPGWKYTTAKPAAEARALAEKSKQEYLQPAEGLSTLLNTPEYFESFRIVQDYNFGDFKEKQRPEAKESKNRAEKRLREIEEKMGIEGLYYKKGRPAAPTPLAQPPAVTTPPAGQGSTPRSEGTPRHGGAAGTPSREQALAQLKALRYPDPNSADAFVGAAATGREDVIKLFLAAGMPVDARNTNGDRAFLTAIFFGYIGAAEILLKAGADVNAKNENGLTPLIELAKYCDEKGLFADIIKAGADVNAAVGGRSGLTALKHANQAGCADFIRMLKKAGAVK